MFCSVKELAKTITNKNALSSVESRVFVDTISSEEANRARAFVTRSRGGAPHIKGLGMLVTFRVVLYYVHPDNDHVFNVMGRS